MLQYELTTTSAHTHAHPLLAKWQMRVHAFMRWQFENLKTSLQSDKAAAT